MSFASATFSMLLVLFTYLVGARAFSRPIGLGAALLVAVEYDLVTWEGRMARR